MRTIVYSNAEPLKNGPANLHRMVGAEAIGPYHHAGLNCQVVDVTLERPTLNTESYVKTVPVEEMHAALADSTERVLQTLDVQIQELTTHRERLAADLAKLRQKAEAA